jgi:hypothetical protein
MQFSRALGRKPLRKWPKFAGASGPQKGLNAKDWAATGNPTPWEVVILCTNSDDPVGVYEKLSSTVDTHGALDLLDIMEVKDSWSHAAHLNNAMRRDGN